MTNNLTIPIVCRGQFVGSVQLSRDVTNMGRSGRSIQRAREESSAPAATGARYTLEDIVGQSPEIQEVRRLIQRIANSSSSVLVYGETGTGKELVVSSIHNASYRKDKTFMPINCAALPESILESLLFGTRRGAFTGAEDRVGLIEECSGGTIYLDEINSMPLKLQSKLLRVLDTKTVMALGQAERGGYPHRGLREPVAGAADAEQGDAAGSVLPAQRHPHPGAAAAQPSGGH